MASNRSIRTDFSVTLQNITLTNPRGLATESISDQTGFWKGCPHTPRILPEAGVHSAAFLPKASGCNKDMTAGLLTRSRFARLPIDSSQQWHRMCKTLAELTATGIVPDSHRCSHFDPSADNRHAEPYIRYKYTNLRRKIKSLQHFLSPPGPLVFRCGRPCLFPTYGDLRPRAAGRFQGRNRAQ